MSFDQPCGLEGQFSFDAFVADRHTPFG
jgi:hypothetical protein